MRRREKPSSFRSGPRRTARNPSGNACGQRIEAIVDSSGGGRLMPASMANEKGWRRRPKDTEYTLDFAATLGGKLCGNQPVCRVLDIATPSSRRRVDGVEVDAAIQDERGVNLISTQAASSSPGRSSTTR
jgi:hypothetical protein